jgi:hypothetical protein
MQYVIELFGLIANSLLVSAFGWVVFLGLGIWIWYKLKVASNQAKYVATFKWLYLEVKVDQTNERSPFAMEQVFAALHAINTGISWGEKYHGKVVPPTTCELVSLGGRVSYIFKIVDRYRNLLESAVFAQYPKAEIVEVEDYLKNLPKHYDPDHAEFDFWGTQMNKRKQRAESCYPIRTYSNFEHTEQKTIVDPLAAVIEAMSNIQPYELLVSQIVFKPVGEDWKKGAEEILRKLRGNPKKPKPQSTLDKVLAFPIDVISFLVNIVIPAPEAKPKVKKEEPPSMIQHLSEGQKQVLAACERQLDKISYEVKVRLFYLAPKNKFNQGLRIPEIIGAYRNFDEPSLNGLKPDMSHTWTNPGYKYSETLEKSYRNYQKKVRKHHFWGAFLARDHWRGSGKCYYNTEELATLFHFPQVPNARISQLEKVETIKSAPPSNLPIGDI